MGSGLPALEERDHVLFTSSSPVCPPGHSALEMFARMNTQRFLTWSSQGKGLRPGMSQ